MIGLVVKLVLGVVLFAGTLVGGLAATGRLNHEGTANIPLLNALFPAPPPAADDPEHGDDAAGDAGGDGHGAAQGPDGKPAPHDAPATPSGEAATPSDASHGAPEEATEQGDAPRKQKTGRSLTEAEAKGGGGGHGEPAGGHGEPAKDAHGATAPAATPAPADKHAPAKPEPRADAARSKPESDFRALDESLADGKNQYRPGQLFRFQGLPAGLTPEQINDAWQRVQGLMAEIDRRKLVLDQQEQLVREQSEDISRRQAALGKERVEIEQMHRQLDAKIQTFQDQVKLVRNDEVAALKRNAATYASFEAEKAAQLFEVMWKTDKGQDEVLKVLEFMETDAVNGILAVLPPAMTQDLLKKRLRVSKEPVPSGKGK
jgi:hypothetical protein